MHPGALRALEFDRIVEVLTGLAVTPTGRDALASVSPADDPADVARLQRETSEVVRFLADHPGFPLRAPTDLESIIGALGVDGRALEAPRLLSLADYLESIEQSRTTVTRLDGAFTLLRELVERVASFRGEIADVRKKIDPSGDVADDASPALAAIRERLRKQRARLRTTLDAFVRGRDTSKYLQEQVVTDRNGRYVLIVRAEHRGAIPGIVHGSSTSGASLFLEPLETVEINNDIVTLEEQEEEEVRRILLALTDAFRSRPDDLSRTLDVATALDVIQARGRFAELVGGVEPVVATDEGFELRGARHPLLMRSVTGRLEDGGEGIDSPVPVDIVMPAGARVLIVAGPNTGGKTVALKTAGLLAAMAQAGLHIPADKGSRLPVFKSVFADIGDEQSISASLSTFSAHVSNVVSMDRRLELPALVLLDEVGAGTDPAEGGALGIAVIDHFRQRGAHLIATTHYDSLKSYASTTEGVAGAAFGFNPETFAPTYRLVYGSPGRSLAIEIAARLGMPAPVIEAARGNLSEPQKQLADHLARIDDDLRKLEQERQQITREHMAVAERERKMRSREEALAEREQRLKRRLDAKVDDQLREARKEIDNVIDGLRTRAAELSERAAVRLNAGGKVRAAGLSTGDVGAMKGDAREALDRIGGKVLAQGTDAPPVVDAPAGEIEVGSRVIVGGMGLEGTVVDIHGKRAEVDVRGKRLRTPLKELRLLSGAPAPAQVRINVDLQPREGGLGELMVIGDTVDKALDRLDKFLDQSTTGDISEIRIVHGHGTGQLRRAVAEFLKNHPLVEKYETAPDNQGGGGATIAYLKD